MNNDSRPSRKNCMTSTKRKVAMSRINDFHMSALLHFNVLLTIVTEQMLKDILPDKEVFLKLQELKLNLRSALLSRKYSLPLWIFEKSFDFNRLSYIDKPKNQINLNARNIWALARLLQIMETSIELIQKGQVITKRNLYYKLVKYYQNRYGQIDVDIDTLCLNLGISRSDIRIFSSSRCIVFGNFILEPQILKCTQEVICNVPIVSKGFEVRTECKVLVIVEKESALYQIHQQLASQSNKGNKKIDKLWGETIFLSSKGYPDCISRTLISHLLPLVETIYFLGDSDIYGLDILLCYSIPYRQWASLLPKIHWIQLQNLINIQTMDPYVLTQSKEDKNKCIQILQRPYFKEIEYFIPFNEDGRIWKEKMSRWKQKAKQIHSGQMKIELQCLFKEMREGWIIEALTPSCCL